jgi:hypothetical protein
MPVVALRRVPWSGAASVVGAAADRADVTGAQLRRAAIKERERRERAAAGQAVTLDAAKVLHAGQLAAFLCALATVVICAGRRWGKSVLACVKAYIVALATPGVTCCLIGATQGSISRIFWRTLRELNRVHLLGASFLKGVEGWTVTMRNGSQIVLLPVDSVEAADKVRGLSRVAFVCVDESQRYKKAILDYLVLDVIKAMFIDLRAQGKAAQLWLMGTPNPAGKIGTFWEYLNRPGVGVFDGTVYENDKLGPREQIERVVDEMLAEEQQTRESVWYQREIMARWVADLARRVYHFDDDRNTYDVLPELTTFAIIGDMGVRDADALAVVGWRDNDPTLYLVREVIKRGQDTLDLAAETAKLIDEFHPILVAFDAGGLGLKTLKTIQKLLKGLPIRAVEKPAVNLQVKALNDRARRGLKCSKRSAFYAQVRNSEWLDGIVNGKIIETGHSDIVPTMRYAALELAHILPSAPRELTDEEAKRQTYLELVRNAEQGVRRARAAAAGYDPDEFSDGMTDDLYQE